LFVLLPISFYIFKKIINLIINIFIHYASNIKDKILPDFVNAIDEKLSYSKSKELFSDSLSQIIDS